MSTFLERILATKHQEVELLYQGERAQVNLSQLPPTRGFAKALTLQHKLAVIAEIKQRSPSKGRITDNFRPLDTARLYEKAGANAISFLTDHDFFDGSIQILQDVRKVTNLPILRKDFIIDEIQIREARVAGADAVLLICAALTDERLCELSQYAKSLNLDVLVEVHNEEEAEQASAANASVYGINNRDLHTFEVSLETTAVVRKRLPEDAVVISESGIRGRSDAIQVAVAGVNGILVGESLMRMADEKVEAAILALKVPLLDTVRATGS